MKFIASSLFALVSLATCGICQLLSWTETSPPVASTSLQRVETQRIDYGATGSADGETNAALANVRRKVDLMEQGGRFLAGIESYTATLTKQEVVGNELLDEQSMHLKCRQKPFSVYLVWLSGDTGREVLYIDGQNDGKLIAHDGGWKARLPAFNLHPECRLAMRDARYPVTSAGFGSLITMMLDKHREDLASDSVASCEVDENQLIDGRRCFMFTTHYKSRELSPTYRKSITYLDYEWNLPVRTDHFEWPAIGQGSDDKNLDQTTLVESYSFTDVKLPTTLSDEDFDRSNPEYRFR